MAEENSKKAWWKNKQTVLAFLAGMAVMLVIALGVNGAMNTKFLPGTVTSQLGGWSDYKPVTDADKQVFSSAMAGLVGVSYTPYEVSIQIVNGTNYNFKCDSIGIYPGAVASKKIVTIYAPINGKPYIISIRDMDK